MKTIVMSLFSIALFAGIASAQHTRLLIGDDQGVYVPLAPVSPTSGPVSGPNIGAFAGQTVRIQFRSTSDSGPVYVLMGTPPSADICTVAANFTRPVSGTSKAIAGVVIVATSDNNTYEFPVPTDLAWKGTCRILSVRLRDGSEHIGRIFFR